MTKRKVQPKHSGTKRSDITAQEQRADAKPRRAAGQTVITPCSGDFSDELESLDVATWLLIQGLAESPLGAQHTSLVDALIQVHEAACSLRERTSIGGAS